MILSTYANLLSFNSYQQGSRVFQGPANGFEYGREFGMGKVDQGIDEQDGVGRYFCEIIGFKIGFDDSAGSIAASQPGQAGAAFNTDNPKPSILEPENVTARTAAHIDNGASGAQVLCKRVQKGGWVHREGSPVVDPVVVGIIIRHDGTGDRVRICLKKAFCPKCFFEMASSSDP